MFPVWKRCMSKNAERLNEIVNEYGWPDEHMLERTELKQRGSSFGMRLDFLTFSEIASRLSSVALIKGGIPRWHAPELSTESEELRGHVIECWPSRHMP
jgi:hypothetical protein